jgi:hypothetical protein
MNSDFDRIFDDCIDRINRGEGIDACLSEYPEYAVELEPLLQAMLRTQQAYSFVPSHTVKREARQRFNIAREELHRKREPSVPLFAWLQNHSRVFATATAAVLIALVGFFGLKPVMLPSEPVVDQGPSTPIPATQPSQSPTLPGPQPSATGNFVFLISDEVNAIGDFESLAISISRIGLQSADDPRQWIEFTPEPGSEVAELTQLQGEDSQEVWKGYIPAGRYTKVFIEVSNIAGVLWEGELEEIRLPSNRLQISKPFDITSTEVTNFVYDITVVTAGKSGQYILKPQIAQSGADQPFKKVVPEGKPDKSGAQNKTGKPEEQTQLDLEIIEGELLPGESIVLLVTFEGEPVEKAAVAINRELVETETGADGRLVITLPNTHAMVRIEATFEDIKGELNVKLGENVK